MSEFRTNDEYLNEIDNTQQKTKDSLMRTQRQLVETEAVAESTLEELRKQGEQLDSIREDISTVDNKLDESSQLQNRFDRWAGNWFGGKKREAVREAQMEQQHAEKLRMSQAQKKIKEVYEHQKYESFSGKWKPVGLYECVESGTSPKAPDLFDPEIQNTIPDSKWNIDYSLTNIDPDGYTYGNSFEQLDKGSGSSNKTWRTYVRRRKWKFIERVNSQNDEVNKVRSRQADREKEKLVAGQQLHLASKIGFVPRSRIDLKETGMSMSSNGGNDGEEEELDDESKAGLQRVNQNDMEIDQMLDMTMASLDRLQAKGQMMGDLSAQQNKKLDGIDDGMIGASNKQSVVNARAKRLLR